MNGRISLIVLVLVVMSVDVDDQHVVELALHRLLAGVRAEAGWCSTRRRYTRRPRSAMRSMGLSPDDSTNSDVQTAVALSAAGPALPHSEFEHREIGGAQQPARRHHDVGRADACPLRDRRVLRAASRPAPRRPCTARAISACIASSLRDRARRSSRSARSISAGELDRVGRKPVCGTWRASRLRAGSALRPTLLAAAAGRRAVLAAALGDDIDLVPFLAAPGTSSASSCGRRRTRRSSCRIPCRARGRRSASRVSEK